MRYALPLPRSAKLLTLMILGPFSLLLALYMTSTTGASRHCIFCTIIAGQTATEIVAETDDYVIFRDIKPASTHHYLAVTKRHIESVKKLTAADDKLVGNMFAGLKEFFETQGIDTEDALFGFHLPPFISVKHLHMHAIAPRSTMTFANKMMFRPNSYWFRTVDEARLMIKENA